MSVAAMDIVLVAVFFRVCAIRRAARLHEMVVRVRDDIDPMAQQLHQVAAQPEA